MRGPKYPIKLAEEERIALERLVKNPTTAQQIALRARTILLAVGGELIIRPLWGAEKALGSKFANESQPRRATIGIWMVVLGQYPANNVFVDFDTKQFCDLLCYLWAAVPWISLFHFNDDLDKLLRWTLGSWLISSAR